MLKIPIFSKNIYVTTDSLKIKKISEFYGAKVPKLRSKKLSRDKVGIQDVLINFIKLNDLTKEKYFFLFMQQLYWSLKE